MKIAFACPSCALAGSVDAALVGRQVRCKQCGHRFPIPAPGEHEPDVYALDEPGPAGAGEESEESVFVSSGRGGRAEAYEPTRVRPEAARTREEEEDAEGPGWGKRLIGIGAAVALVLLAVAMAAPRGTLIAGAATIVIGLVMVLAGYAAGAYGAFCEDFVYGMLYLAIPLYAGYYIVTRWDDLWRWFAVSTAGVGVVAAGTQVVRWSGVGL